MCNTFSIKKIYNINVGIYVYQQYTAIQSFLFTAINILKLNIVLVSLSLIIICILCKYVIDVLFQ